MVFFFELLTGHRRLMLSAVLIACCAASASAGLQADELALIVNRNVPASVQLAEFYARARNLPEGRIIPLDLPGSEELDFDRYERDVVLPVRRFLRQRRLEAKVRCLVTFYGVPIRVAPKVLSQQERDELARLQQDLTTLCQQLETLMAALESIARQLDHSLEPGTGNDLDALGLRSDRALSALQRAMPQAEPQQQQIIGTHLMEAMKIFAGPVGVIEHLDGTSVAKLEAHPESGKTWAAVRQGIPQLQKELPTLQERRFDSESRARLRDLVRENLGAFSYGRLLQGQIDYLTSDGTPSALDNELSLLWWTYYPRAKWQANPLHYAAPPLEMPPALMVMRLDGPQDGTARDIIIASLKAEREGLRGRVVMDSRGIAPVEKDGKSNAYGAYDQTIRRLVEIVTTKTRLLATWDDKPAVFPARSVNDVALYCGWYSLRHYVPAFTFNPGAVGFHVASLECVSLRGDKEGGWVAGLLNDGVAATLGPVAEPYLHSFPLADEFFPLLLTGKLTLAEVYWLTNPLSSWMMTAIGDPLYTPYKTEPGISVDALPQELRGIFLDRTPPR